MQQRRAGLSAPPKVVSILCLSDDVDLDRTWALLATACQELDASGAISTIGAARKFQAEQQQAKQHGHSGMGEDEDDEYPEPAEPANDDGLSCPPLSLRTMVMAGGKLKARVTWVPPPR